MKRIARKILPMMEELRYSLSTIDENNDSRERVTEFIEKVSIHQDNLSTFIKVVENDNFIMDKNTFSIFLSYNNFLFRISEMKGKELIYDEKALILFMKAEYATLCEMIDKLSNS